MLKETGQQPASHLQSMVAERLQEVSGCVNDLLAWLIC